MTVISLWRCMPNTVCYSTSYSWVFKNGVWEGGGGVTVNSSPPPGTMFACHCMAVVIRLRGYLSWIVTWMIKHILPPTSWLLGVKNRQERIHPRQCVCDTRPVGTPPQAAA